MDNNAHDMRRVDFLVNKADLGQQEFRGSGTRAALAEGQVRLRVDKFALTANNVTYAAFGDAMKYWHFFPSNDDTFGRVPVWGFAVVDESRCEGVNPGERIYGFLPMSTEFIVMPVSISDGSFADGMEHRKVLHMVYNQYTRVNGDPVYDPAREAQQMILRPLFMTSYLIECFLRDNDYFSGGRVILSSASSKTAIGVAYQIAHSEGRSVELVGLTSAANQAFVRELGLYDAVVTYDDVAGLGTEVATVFVDMAGNSEVLRRLHTQLNDSLQYSCLVGASHWDANEPPGPLAGPKPEWFFAPAQFQERAAEAGAAAVLQQFSLAWRSFVVSTDDWMEVTELQGEAAIQQTFNQVLSGTAPPSKAYILSY